VKRSLAYGYDLFDVLQIACSNPVKHYGLPIGLLQPKQKADFIVVNNLQDFEVLATYCKGECLAKDGKTLLSSLPIGKINNFRTSLKNPDDFKVRADGSKLRVIAVIDGQLITKEEIVAAKADNAGNLAVDLPNDILKLVVVNRYQDTPPQVGFVKNFGLKRGAIASSVAHDSHNIIAVGTSDEEISQAVNLVIKEEGGLAAVAGHESQVLPLPVAGLMSNLEGYQVAKMYVDLEAFVKLKLSPKLQSPFMTLSFLALLVIPELKLSDKGLFDGRQFRFVPLSF
jgi:adenine deaminase